MSFSLNVDTSALDRLMDMLGDEAEAAARPAAQASAQVFYKAVKANVAALGRNTGNLDRSIYQVYSKSKSGSGRAVYHVSWNAQKAPHGHLVENGHIQRYKVYVGKDGRWYTAIRPGMKGKNAPPRKAPQSVKDEYYVPLAAPRQVPAQSFVRKALSSSDEALAAAESVLLTKLGAI